MRYAGYNSDMLEEFRSVREAEKRYLSEDAVVSLLNTRCIAYDSLAAPCDQGTSPPVSLLDRDTSLRDCSSKVSCLGDWWTERLNALVFQNFNVLLAQNGQKRPLPLGNDNKERISHGKRLKASVDVPQRLTPVPITVQREPATYGQDVVSYHDTSPHTENKLCFEFQRWLKRLQKVAHCGEISQSLTERLLYGDTEAHLEDLDSLCVESRVPTSPCLEEGSQDSELSKAFLERNCSSAWASSLSPSTKTTTHNVASETIADPLRYTVCQPVRMNPVFSGGNKLLSFKTLYHKSPTCLSTALAQSASHTVLCAVDTRPSASFIESSPCTVETEPFTHDLGPLSHCTPSCGPKCLDNRHQFQPLGPQEAYAKQQSETLLLHQVSATGNTRQPASVHQRLCSKPSSDLWCSSDDINATQCPGIYPAQHSSQLHEHVPLNCTTSLPSSAVQVEYDPIPESDKQHLQRTSWLKSPEPDPELLSCFVNLPSKKLAHLLLEFVSASQKPFASVNDTQNGVSNSHDCGKSVVPHQAAPSLAAAASAAATLLGFSFSPSSADHFSDSDKHKNNPQSEVSTLTAGVSSSHQISVGSPVPYGGIIDNSASGSTLIRSPPLDESPSQHILRMQSSFPTSVTPTVSSFGYTDTLPDVDSTSFMGTTHLLGGKESCAVNNTIKDIPISSDPSVAPWSSRVFSPQPSNQVVTFRQDQEDTTPKDSCVSSGDISDPNAFHKATPRMHKAQLAIQEDFLNPTMCAPLGTSSPRTVDYTYSSKYSLAPTSETSSTGTKRQVSLCSPSTSFSDLLENGFQGEDGLWYRRPDVDDRCLEELCDLVELKKREQNNKLFVEYETGVSFPLGEGGRELLRACLNVKGCKGRRLQGASVPVLLKLAYDWGLWNVALRIKVERVTGDLCPKHAAFVRFKAMQSHLRKYLKREQMHTERDGTGQITDIRFEEMKYLTLGKEGREKLRTQLRRLHDRNPYCMDDLLERYGFKYSELRNATVPQLLKMAHICCMWNEVIDACKNQEAKRDCRSMRKQDKPVFCSFSSPSTSPAFSSFLPKNGEQTFISAVQSSGNDVHPGYDLNHDSSMSLVPSSQTVQHHATPPHHSECLRQQPILACVDATLHSPARDSRGMPLITPMPRPASPHVLMDPLQAGIPLQTDVVESSSLTISAMNSPCTFGISTPSSTSPVARSLMNALSTTETLQSATKPSVQGIALLDKSNNGVSLASRAALDRLHNGIIAEKIVKTTSSLPQPHDHSYFPSLVAGQNVQGITSY